MMLNTVAELCTAILARCGCEPKHDWTISLLAAGQTPAAVAAFGDVPAPREVRGKRKTRPLPAPPQKVPLTANQLRNH